MEAKKLFSMLFINVRLNLVCCHLPMDQKLVFYMAQYLGVDCHNIIFWRNCLKRDYPSLAIFFQRLWPIDFSFLNHVNTFLEISLVSVLVLMRLLKLNHLWFLKFLRVINQSIYLAGCIYYDLSENLCQVDKLSRPFNMEEKPSSCFGQFVSRESQCSGGQGFLSLEAWGPTMAEIWPDCTRPSSMRDSFLTPWNVLRCYLESILQVAPMHELIGNSAEAEVLLRTGQEISCFQGLPVFAVTFTSVLGQLCRKRQLWDAAEGELKRANKLLAENVEFISCKTCKLTLEISVDVQRRSVLESL